MKDSNNLLRRNTLRRLTAVAITLCCIAKIAPAQEPSPSPPGPSQIDKAELHQALLDVTNPWTVMCVAAHPDDEDGTTLTVLRRKYGAHTVSLFTTFGEGGQNAVGPELYEELGVIRARETMQAAEIQGSEPHFLGLKDFGFSKSMEETFRVWGHDEALRRMVLKLRELHPDVIITNHDTSRGHGHHQATGQLIIEAFDAAADPSRFPEQLNELKPWQAQRLFVRIFGSGAADKTTTTEKIVSIDPNEIDPVRDTSFAEQALAALQQHATQGPWPKTIEQLARMRGSEAGKLPLIQYRLVRNAPNAPPLPSVMLTVGGGMSSPAFVAGLVPPITAPPLLTKFIDEPNQVLEGLIQLCLRKADYEPSSADPVKLRLMETRQDKALAIAAGVSLTINSSEPVLIPGHKTTFVINLTNAGRKPLQISKLSFAGWGKELPVDAPDHLLEDTDTSSTMEVTTPEGARYTVPKPDHLYDGYVFGQPFEAHAEIDIEGAKFQVNSQRRLEVVPAVEIRDITPSPCVRTEEALGHCDQFSLDLTNHLEAPFRGKISISVNATGDVRQMDRQLVLASHESRLEKIINSNSVPDREALRKLRNSSSVGISIYPVNSTLPITQRSVTVVYSNARLAQDLRVGYLPSFDQTLERSLASFGVEAKALTVEEIKNTDLSTYNTIIIDNRGYEAHPELVGANSSLLQYVQQGGTLIVFYHKDNEWNPDTNKNRPQLAPYPIILGGERVTDETAPVRFAQPRHRLLNFPNRIRQADFENWIQERGLYYPKDWDSRYSALFFVNDKGEPPLRGGLLVARHGKGNYIYTSMVWYRQLRAGVPGAYRMFANMISYGKSQQRSFRRKSLRPSTLTDMAYD